jgi:SNF2 family DNA or RNA helicase
MASISIDLDTAKSEIYLYGDIEQLIRNRYALRYMKDYLHPMIDSDRICIPIVDSETFKLLSDIRTMLKKYGFDEKQSETSEQALKDFYEEESKFSEFSLKALQIRNNECSPADFKAFADSIVKNMPARSLYPLQLLSAYHLAFAQNACNFSVPGAGKTSIVYGAYTYLKNLGDDDPKKVDQLLIIGPLSSFGPWELEYAECFGKKPRVKRLISGLGRDEKIDYLYSRHTFELTLISYASLVSLKEALIFFLKYNRVMVVLDEAHKAKNTSGGITSQAVAEISRYCSARAVLTGTPAPNGYEDLYNMFKFIWPMKNIIGFEVNQLKDMTSRTNDARIERLIENISPFFIRIRKSDLNIPVAIVHPVIEVEMGPAQRRIYDFIERKYIEALLEEKVIEISSRFKALLMQAKMIRLMQAATNPVMLKTPLYEFLEDDECPQEAYQAINDADVLNEIIRYENNEIPAKYIAVRELVEKIIGNGGKVVVWATFINTIHELKEYFARYGIDSQELYGAIPVEQEGIVEEADEQILTRERIVREFQSEESPYKVIIANPFAVAESISLHKACHNAIYIERSFNAAHFVQSKDRIHRYGLKPDDETHYYFVVAKDSIDETIDARLTEKERRMIEIMERMPIPLFENISSNIGDEDIKALIRDYVRRTKKT